MIEVRITQSDLAHCRHAQAADEYINTVLIAAGIPISELGALQRGVLVGERDVNAQCITYQWSELQ